MKGLLSKLGKAANWTWKNISKVSNTLLFLSTVATVVGIPKYTIVGGGLAIATKIADVAVKYKKGQMNLVDKETEENLPSGVRKWIPQKLSNNYPAQK